jgi:hypothetical protein
LLAARTFARLIVAGAVAVVVGCKGDAHSRPAETSGPTYRDLAPLLSRRCAACHGADGVTAIVPPALTSYDQVRRVAGPLLLAIRRRMMPPFGADNTGLCGTWIDAPWLDASEIAAFGAWVDRGMPRGGDPTALQRTPPPSLAGGRDTLMAVDPGVAFAPGLGERADRCFVVPSDQRNATAITAVSVTAMPAGAVRQASLYALPDARALRTARALDARDAEPGWPCSGAPAIAGATLLASWSRNTPVQRLPAGTGVPLAPGTAMVLQLRYDLVASPPAVPVRASMVLAVGAIERAARLVTVGGTPFTLPPGQAQARVRMTWTADRDTTLLGLVPSMHSLGRVLDLARQRAGAERCLAHFGHWDPYDQQLFRAATAIDVARGDTVTLTCEFSTTSRTEDVKMGEAPDEEQCLAHLYLVDAR